MQYPDLALIILVEMHKSRVDSMLRERKYKTPDLDSIVAEAAQEYEGMIEESLENYRRYLQRTSLDLPDGESTVLLGKLITDPRMKDVQRALAKLSLMIGLSLLSYILAALPVPHRPVVDSSACKNCNYDKDV